MTINNHFHNSDSVSRKELAKELKSQEFDSDQSSEALLLTYRQIAEGYALTENAVAVLSDMQQNVSYIYAGRFATKLEADFGIPETRVPSIWEENIFRLIHPDDLSAKHVGELLFFNYIKRIPRKKRGDYHLLSKLRMKTSAGGYIPVLHRMFYVQDPGMESVRLALCLYSPLSVDIPVRCCAVNSVDGTVEELRSENPGNLLSARERQVLSLIAKGCHSKEIAGILSISKNTVSRHRQSILSKLHVRNSIEACRVASDIGLLNASDSLKND